MPESPTEPVANVRPTPKRLILSLLSAPVMSTVEVGHLIRWGELFAIDAAATRVAVGRLAKSGLIQSSARGTYAIGPQGRALAETARQWSAVEEKICLWSGDWLLVHTSHLGRVNKTALRQRERALRLEGFAELITGLWCRPDNLVQSLDTTAQGLIALGLESEAIIARVGEFERPDADALNDLWPRFQLEAGYRQQTARMIASEKRLPSLGIEDQVRETFLVGEAVIRLINSDPLLPREMVDTGARQRLIQQMEHYNELGQAVWEEFRLTSG